MRSIVAPISLTVYLAFILWLTLLLPIGNGAQLNLIPFRTMAGDFRLGGAEFIVNFLGNILAFIPFGILIPATFARPLRWWKVGLLCAAISVFIEVGQFALGRRVADVDDVLLNTLGGLVGYPCFLAWRSLKNRQAAIGLTTTNHS